jgi:hypothetical protein
MAVTADVAAGQANIFEDTIGRWDDDLTNSVKPEEKERIAHNITRALEWRGLAVSLNVAYENQTDPLPTEP